MAPATVTAGTTTTMTSNRSNETDDGCSADVSSASQQMKDMINTQWGIPVLILLTIFFVVILALFFHTWMMIRRHVPYGNRRMFLVRLTGIFPVFAMTSLAGVYVPKASLIANWGASLYFASTLYVFVLLIVDYYGGVEMMERHLEGLTVSLTASPLTCCIPCMPHINFDIKNFHRFRRLVMQTAYIRPICVFLGAVLWADGIYQPSLLTASSAYLYLSLISLLSTLFAVYGLSIIYNATSQQLEHFMIKIKFLTMKSVLIMTNVQNLLIAILVHTGVIPCVGPIDSNVRGEIIYNMLVVAEMFFLSIFFKLYYWRWMVKHEYGHKFAAASVGDGLDDELEERERMNVTHDRIQDLQGRPSSVNGSFSNVSRTASFKSETVV